MTGEKKIVGLWRGVNGGEDVVVVETADTDAAMTTALPAEPPLDVAPLGLTADISEPAWDADWDAANAARDWSWLTPAALALAAVGWTGFFVWSKTSAFSAMPPLAAIPDLVIALSGPLALILLVGIWIQRNGKTESARYARAAQALRTESEELGTRVAALTVHLDAAHERLSEQGKQLNAAGFEAVARIQDSATTLSDVATTISSANAAVSQSSQATLQQMEGILAGLPKIDTVAQRLADSFRQAGLVAHQQGASLEAQLAAIGEQGARTAQDVENAAAALTARAAELKVEGDATTAAAIANSTRIAAATESSLSQTQQGLAAFGAEVDAQVARVDTNIDAALNRIQNGFARTLSSLVDNLTDAETRADAVGPIVEQNYALASALATKLGAQIIELTNGFAELGSRANDRLAGLSAALSTLDQKMAGFAAKSHQGSEQAGALVEKADSLLLALDAVTREVEEGLPAAFARLDDHVGRSKSMLGALQPQLERQELIAQSAAGHIAGADQQLIAHQERLMAVNAQSEASLGGQLAQITGLEARLQGFAAEAENFAQSSGARMVAALVQVRETAGQAATRAREAMDEAISGSADHLRATSADALKAALTGEVTAQLTAIEEASERAVTSAQAAADRLMRQMITIMDTSASIEKRIVEAESAIAASDRDTLAMRVGLLTESLKSTAIDLTKVLSSEVTDIAWDAYLKGDRGVFARRAVRLIDNGEAREILRHYQDDADFRGHVNLYIHDFEAILRALMGTRDGQALSVTLLSSDIGKLYVALAQAIDRLRN
ncbi:MAG: hypothetical protein RLZZ58_72 [Pseudomonadota bacterium]